MRGKLWGILVVGLAGLTACTTTSEPVRKFTKGDELAYYEFSSPGTFEEGTYGDNVARLQVRE
ncbi:MAG: hypothetical protein K8I60_22360, partial [Anaerolineae bacterium]|nr:hypothetical protein [Anaerolineae bacterium]